MLYSTKHYLCIKFKGKEVSMARPIKETPILYGKDAERFIQEMENVKPASEAEKKRVRTSYEKIKKLATFMM